MFCRHLILKRWFLCDREASLISNTYFAKFKQFLTVKFTEKMMFWCYSVIVFAFTSVDIALWLLFMYYHCVGVNSRFDLCLFLTIFSTVKPFHISDASFQYHKCTFAMIKIVKMNFIIKWSTIIMKNEQMFI